MSTIEATGKTIEDAVRSGLVRLGRMKEEVDIEILEEPKSGFFGVGSKPARVRITEKADVTPVPSDVVQAELEKEVLVEEPQISEPSEDIKAAEASVSDGEEDEVSEAVVNEPEEAVFSAEEAAAKGKAFLQEVLKNMGIEVVIEKMI